MAEMTVAEAIAVLHNNQYQKHIGNGEYDYIHPLTDAQAKGIECLIEQQAAEIEKLNKVIDKACGELAHSSVDCPDEECNHDEHGIYPASQEYCAACWRKYFEKEMMK